MITLKFKYFNYVGTIGTGNYKFRHYTQEDIPIAPSNVLTLPEVDFLAMASPYIRVIAGNWGSAGDFTFYTTNNGANIMTAGSKGYPLIKDINSKIYTEIVTANQFFETFGITKTNKGTEITRHWNWEFYSSFGGRLTTTQGTDGGSFSVWEATECEAFKSLAPIEDFLFIVYDSKTDTAAAYELDKYNEVTGAFTVSAEIDYYKIISCVLRAGVVGGGETWLLNETLSFGTESWSYNIDFVSDASRNSYNTITFDYGGEQGAGYLMYNSDTAYDLEYASDPDTGWHDQAYRTITFLTSPTGNLLTWLQENGTKQ